MDSHEPPLTAPLTLAFDYKRSVGPTLSAFFTALRDRRIVGVRGSDGRVHVPVVEYDPVTCERLTQIVPVGSVGTVLSWTWQSEPLEGQPLDRPFAWALIKLDGADTPLLHAVDGQVRTGDRVHAHWVDDPVGAITDIACFAPGGTPEPVPDAPDETDPVTIVMVPEFLRVQHSASRPESIFLRALRNGTLLGARSGDDGKVYFPPREADPATGRELDQFVELPDRGIVTTFAIINIPFPGQRIKPPYVAAYILLDGADIPFLHLVTEIDAADVR
ncbi:MAG: DNA-binding protein, partial [Mycobacterium sp.]|nr:DNA-binding protein [Mycobacterium sp.]